ncbi:putative Ig domain-containing protein [Arthrobacter sp. ISL-48]|uniref:putative Ig domain-containing protein n=1 Tax=Arthrobacter sp. ISL-48 TaxID=2819110 RepID=UPI001BEC61E5|nr:putative Ig domain-containing protein [Arthrobacter sp. ISL-48]MBT2534202.1 putative Ig domain-containing protein [Arthrobacter sp. ISL-48]
MRNASMMRRWARLLGLAAAVALVAPAGSFPLPGSAAPAVADTGQDVTITESVDASGFVHPGIGVTAASLRNARAMVKAGTEPWKSYYAAMAETPFAAKDFRSSNAGSVLDQPGTTAFNSQGVQSKLIRDAFGAYTQAVLYVITGDPVYRENGMRLIRTWSNIDPAKYAYYPDAHIHSGVPLYRLVAAAEIFRATSVPSGYAAYDLGWNDQDTTKLSANLIAPMTETFLHTNWRYLNQHDYPLTGAIAGYIFTGNRDRYNEAVEWYTVNASTSRPEQNGSMAALFPLISKDDPLNTYGYSFVQHQEMGRDQAHAWDGVNIQGALARFLTVQGTKIDPSAGTASTAPDAVSPYKFLGDRLLKGANAFTGYMLGYETPWIDTTGGPGSLSEAYRGRLYNPIDELYNVYKYDLGVDVDKEAPYVAELHAKADGPKFYWGTGLSNSWDSNPDYSPEYWLSLPAQVAGQTRPVATDPKVQLETRSSAMDTHSKVMTEDDRTFVRVDASKKGNTIAVRTLMYPSRSGYSPVGVQFRTNGPATLAIGQDPATRLEVPLPDTHNEWRYVTYDVDADKLAGKDLGGENLAYFTVLGTGSVRADFDYVNLEAKTQLTPPQFPADVTTPIIAIAGAAVTRSLAATDAPGEVLKYNGVGLPAGASLDSATAELKWKPSAGDVGTATFQVVADDGTTVSTRPVTVVVAADRQAAYDAALKGFDPNAVYESPSFSAFDAVRTEATSAMQTADDAGYLAQLVRLQGAVAGLRLLTPHLADDGSIDYRGLVTTNPTSVQPRNLVDGDFNTTTGDLRAPFTLDFGQGFQVSADSFGLQARFNFANRSQGANVYGSRDGRTWTLLTERETTNTTASGFAMETIPVRAEVAGQTFRYLKVQVDHPGVPTDPAYPGISSFSEFRIHGERHEVANAISSLSISTSNANKGLATNGDTVTFDAVATEPLSTLNVVVEGAPATATSTDGIHWKASAVLPSNVEYGRDVQFTVDYRTVSGKLGTTLTATTDGSRLALWNTAIQRTPIVQGWVNASTPAWPGTGTTQANGWRMFDQNFATAPDTTTANGWVTVKPTDGTRIIADMVRVYPRSDQIARGNGTVILGSNDGGATWQTFMTVTGMSAANWYTFTLPQRADFGQVRVLDEHGGHVNIAEVEFLHRAS